MQHSFNITGFTEFTRTCCCCFVLQYEFNQFVGALKKRGRKIRVITNAADDPRTNGSLFFCFFNASYKTYMHPRWCDLISAFYTLGKARRNLFRYKHVRWCRLLQRHRAVIIRHQGAQFHAWRQVVMLFGVFWRFLLLYVINWRACEGTCRISKLTKCFNAHLHCFWY